MEAPIYQPQSLYALVSSLYGPGTLACWYLTTLSVLVSWTIHPQKRKSGSIDVDFIAVLTLPAVAAGHLISQVQRFAAPEDDGIFKYAQTIAAIEAPFSVIESFMAVSIVLFLVAVWMFCLRRAICVALIGLLCLVIECYMHFSNFRDLDLDYRPSTPGRDHDPRFSRSFVADFTGLVIAILVTLAVCAVTASAIVTYMLSSRISHQAAGRAEQGRAAPNPAALQHNGEAPAPTTRERSTEGLKRKWRRDSEEEKRLVRASAWTTMIFLPATFLLTLSPSAFNATFYHTVPAGPGRTLTISARLTRFAAHFFPHTTCSFADLDQAVATAAGATVLGFSVYSVAKAHYKIQGARRTAQREGSGVELMGRSRQGRTAP